MHKTEKRESREGRSGRGGSGVRRAMNHKLDALQPCRSHLIWPLWSSHARRGLGAWLRQYYDINPACEYTFMSGCVFPSRPLEEDTRKTLSRTAGLDRKRERKKEKRDEFLFSWQQRFNSSNSFFNVDGGKVGWQWKRNSLLLPTQQLKFFFNRKSTIIID